MLGMTSDTTSSIAVLGLGAMGSALVRAVAAAGTPVQAWSRSPRTLADIGFAEPRQVTLHESPTDAAAAADLVVVCVRDQAAAREVLDVIAPVSVGRLVVNLTTGTPDQSAATAREARASGLTYVTGAIMVPTSMVGTEDCSVLYAGAGSDLDRLRPLADALAGSTQLTGEDHAVPAALDLAMLNVYFTGMYAFFHSAALASAHGIQPQRFLAHAQEIVATLGGSLPELAAAVSERTYDGGEASLDMCTAFLDLIVGSSHERGIAPGLAAAVLAASRRAAELHPPATDWDVVAEDFLAPR